MSRVSAFPLQMSLDSQFEANPGPGDEAERPGASARREHEVGPQGSDVYNPVMLK